MITQDQFNLRQGRRMALAFGIPLIQSATSTDPVERGRAWDLIHDLGWDLESFVVDYVGGAVGRE